MVKLQDPVLAKRYGIKTFPSLVYFRNGNPLTFDGKVSHFWVKPFSARSAYVLYP